MYYKCLNKNWTSINTSNKSEEMSFFSEFIDCFTCCTSFSVRKRGESPWSTWSWIIICCPDGIFGGIYFLLVHRILFEKRYTKLKLITFFFWTFDKNGIAVDKRPCKLHNEFHSIGVCHNELRFVRYFNGCDFSYLYNDSSSFFIRTTFRTRNIW